jgi:hypothetical protein
MYDVPKDGGRGRNVLKGIEREMVVWSMVGVATVQ